MTRKVYEIVADIDFIDEADRRLLSIHDRTLGENAVLRPGEGPLEATEYALVREGLLLELGTTYFESIDRARKGALKPEEGEE